MQTPFVLRKSLLATTSALCLLSGFAYGQTQALNYEAKEISSVLQKYGNYNLNIPGIWARGITGKGSIIAIIDQGFDLTHKDINSKVIGTMNFMSPGSAITWGYHGTQMASIAAGANNGSGTVGVAPDAQLLLAQVGSGGTSTNMSPDLIQKAVDWASANGATVINMSLGSAFDLTWQKGVTQMAPGIFKAAPGYNSLYNFGTSAVQAFAVGTNRGSILVAAAGNQGLAYSQVPGMFATQVDSKGNLVLGGKMLIVGYAGTDGNIAASSNKAGSICNNIVGTTCNDPYLVKDFFVVAPGAQMYGAVANQLGVKDASGALNTSGAVPVTGSSGATAFVSGGVALMKQAWPQLKPEQIVAIVLNTATPMAGCSSDVCGRGMVNFDKATQPMGTLVLANNTKLTGSGIQGKTLSGTAIVGSGAVSLTASSILQNTQVVDGVGRNYAVDITKAVGYNNNLNYQFASPWMAMAPVNYKQMTTPIGKNASLTVMGSENGGASIYEWQQNDMTRLSFEFGTIQERDGFLGTQGYGAMGFGNSMTTWMGAGFKQNLFGNTNLIGNYSMGITNVSNKQDSMVQIKSGLISDSWKLGIAEDYVFFKGGKTKDTLTFAISQPVAVRSGTGTVTGVTGYNYTDNGDGTSTANPITQSERVNLAPKIRETNLIVGYNIAVENHTTIGVNLVQQFNIAGQPGVNGKGVAFMVRSTF